MNRARTASARPLRSSTRMALGFMMMPAPTGLSCAARSSTLAWMPRSASSRASESPPMPPPTMTILISGMLIFVSGSLIPIKTPVLDPA